MARPKQYSSSPARQAAYRKRLKQSTVVVDRGALERLEAKLETLQQAVQDAAAEGDTLASACAASSADTTLDKLIVAFQNAMLNAAK